MGMWAGLVRMGWTWPVLRPQLPMAHGPLMVGGFLGTLIGLERAVALRALVRPGWPTFLAPLSTALGALVLLLQPRAAAGAVLMTLGSLGLVVVLLRMYRLQPQLHGAVLVLAGVLWPVGNLLWLTGRSLAEAMLWWTAFLVLTIAGERLELSRLLQPGPRVRRSFLAAVGLVVLGCVVATVAYAAGVRLFGLGLFVLAVWLFVHDVARRRLAAGAQARYIAMALLVGFGWLAVGGVLAVAYGGMTAGPYYDAVWHAVLVGFVFSMIFAHALLIFPAVLGHPVPYRPRFYLPLALLQAGLVVRLVGDLALNPVLRRWGGLANALAVLLFFALMLMTALQGDDGRWCFVRRCSSRVPDRGRVQDEGWLTEDERISSGVACPGFPIEAEFRTKDG
ncbi:MAG: hypothetical protein RMN24_15750 [Anaerolineae bacterium]|nr:hypothetical protein [Anaerolineae bacterium]